MFKLHEQNGAWGVSQDSENTKFAGGFPITYEEYKRLKDKPHEAEKLFKRDSKGKLLRRDKDKA